MVTVPVHGRANSANLLDSLSAATMDRRHGPYGVAVLATVAWRLSSSTRDRRGMQTSRIKYASLKANPSAHPRLLLSQFIFIVDILKASP